MNQEVCTLVNSKRNQPKLIARGYLLIKDKSSNNKYYWCCEFKESLKCKGRAITLLEDENHVLVKFNEHNHAPEASRVNVFQTINTMKEKAVCTQDQPIQIIQNELISMPQNSFYYMPNKEALRKQINRARNENNEVLQPEIELGNEKLMIFCTPSNLTYLQDAEYWLMDGTFKTVPTLFQQLYTIHVPIGGEDNSRIFPMVYILMTSKAQESYRRVFDELIELGNQAGVDLSPPIIITDFEQAVINATQSEFPDSIHKGCFFHFCQNIWRKIQSEGLAIEYGNDEDFSLKLRHLTALAFLPPSEIPAAFDQIKLSLPENAAGVTEYFETTYVHGRITRQTRNGSTCRAPPLFPPELWSISDLVELGYPRTQNIVEGWHNRWNNLIGKAHIGVYTIIQEMRKEQQQTELQIESINRGAPRPYQRNQYVNRENRILSVFNNRIHTTLVDFLRGMAHNISL
ncbi:hypothetical protein RhiirA5_420830 [Rhizophagus irregularis]|uniref:MULE transposase domain-containing protein n=1 Tax=Rhizophagus irregularis TaxID=588596 RepID=A0A2N0PFC1_9GLOM|nr:hypothetical protein RhiirA5_420830 [Rhizophagus irregularis]